ncbi:hypothetical protein DPMN_061569 [Dreissena polymorpha]|uniref:Uncharacterized protein n=1 Tax=Dreissena polymorpha TaxID=45954 RepID=A0A9D4C7V1_DREPO|nr:hypothetical protein DPMN_061569 [Dreissena polymorpha]
MKMDLASLNVLLNPSIEKDSMVKDIDVVAEYLCSVGFEGCLESYGMLMTFIHPLVDNSTKLVCSTTNSANSALN